MHNRKNQNSFLFLTTLGVHLGLVLVGAIVPVSAQNTQSSEPVINRKPLRDLGYLVQQKVAAKEVDLNAPFAVELTCKLTPDGTIDPRTVHYIKNDGDTKLISVVKQTIEAVSDSGFFAYLRQLGSENIAISVSQDDKNFNAALKAEANTSNRAKSVASSLTMLLSVATMQTQGLSEQDKVLLHAVKVQSVNSGYVIELMLPATVFQEALKKELDKSTKREQK